MKEKEKAVTVQIGEQWPLKGPSIVLGMVNGKPNVS